jgi:uncharacterized protein
MMDEYYFSYDQIHNTIKRSAKQIMSSGFMPDLILAIGAGGFIPARILRTYIDLPIIAITVSFYDENDQLLHEPTKHQWLDNIDITNKKVLLVDEIDDSRSTLEFCLRELLARNPTEIGVFVLHNKQKPKRGNFPQQIKHIFVGEDVPNKWIRYPWDAIDINEHERLANAEPE